MKLWKLLSAIICFFISANVNAALIDNDFYTTDSVSELDWLDLTETNGFSYDYINSQLASGGVYDGWRYATITEVENLFIQFGLPLTNSDESPVSSATLTGITNMVSFLGDTGYEYEPWPGGYLYGSVGIVDYTPVLGAHLRLSLGAYTSDFDSVAHIGTTLCAETDFCYEYTVDAYATVGHYLVQASVVPVPAAVWLFGSGLVGLVGFARRKKA